MAKAAKTSPIDKQIKRDGEKFERTIRQAEKILDRIIRHVEGKK